MLWPCVVCPMIRCPLGKKSLPAIFMGRNHEENLCYMMQRLRVVLVGILS